MNLNFRTDLAEEEIKRINTSDLLGIKVSKDELNGISFEKTIIDEEHDDRINKKPGTYYTIDLRNQAINDNDVSNKVVKTLSIILIEMMKKLKILDKKGMIIGLGNINITPDSLGPYAVDNIIVTRHLFKNGLNSQGFSEISGYSPGVMGTTGIETSDIVSAIKDKVDVDYLIVVDALASSDATKVNKTIQLTDTGISPGSGVGNKRKEISYDTFQIPVIAIGVPTVVDAATLTTNILTHLENHLKKIDSTNNYLGQFGRLDETSRKEILGEALSNTLYEMMVTPKEIDEVIEDLGKIIASSIDIAVHKNLREEYLTIA